jgi:hypothetical protein
MGKVYQGEGMEPQKHGISASILENFDYYVYLQQSIGYCSMDRPQLPKRAPEHGYLRDMEIRIEYLTAMHEEWFRRNGIMEQQPLRF